LLTVATELRVQNTTHLNKPNTTNQLLMLTMNDTSGKINIYAPTLNEVEESAVLKSLLGHESNSNGGGQISLFFKTIWQEQCAKFLWKNRQSLLQDSTKYNPTNVECNFWNDRAVKESPHEELVHQGWHALIQLLEAAGSDLTDAPHTAPLLFKEQTSVTSELQSTYRNNLFAAYLDGCSVVLNHADWRSPWIAALCQDLQQSFPHAYANVYITPPGSQAVDAHADDRDVFVIQVAGKKSWKIYERIPIPYPYPEEQVGKAGLEVPKEVLDGPSLIETTLTPGDVIYMPRGYVHEARAVADDFSFHVTVALATHDWTLAGIMTTATQQILHSVIDYRKAIPHRIGMGGPPMILAQSMEALQREIQDAFQLLQEKINSETIASNQELKFKRHNQRVFSVRMNLMHNMRFPTTKNGNTSFSVVGPQAAMLVGLHSRIRPAKDDEKLSVMMDQPRGLLVREEVADDIIQILTALKMAKDSTGVAVKDLRSMLDARKGGGNLICQLTLLSFVKVCVAQGALAVARLA